MHACTGPATTLAEAPTNVFCRIESIDAAVRELGYYTILGLQKGTLARVLAKWPEGVARIIEVELGDGLISLPMHLAKGVVVQPCQA